MTKIFLDNMKNDLNKPIIKGSFLDKFLSTDICLEQIEPYFKNYKNEDWEHSNSGYFSYEFSEGEIILLFVNCIDVGLSLCYNYNVPNKKEGKQWYSIGNENFTNELIDADDQYFVPKDSCLDIKTSWEVVVDFFKNPTKKSNKIKWIEEDKIDWSSIEHLM